MQKTLLILLLLFSLCFSPAKSQQLYRNSYAEISFFSETPIEDISAKNVASASLIDIDKNEVAVRIPMAKFIFPNKRMEEHFQENYLDTGKYPYATFKGKINESIDWEKESRVKVSATGILTMHGISHTETIMGEISIVPSQRLVLDANFNIILARYNVEIPALLWTKIAETVKLGAIITYLPVVNIPPSITQK